MDTMTKVINTCLTLIIIGVIAGIGLIWLIAYLIGIIWKI